jgi:nicotinate-nucleotide adenylyltransferase
MGTACKRIVLFGGTFDPPHVGHLTMAQLALEQSGANEVWFLPAPLPPHKHLETLHLTLRKEMVRVLIAGYDRFHLCLIEEQLPKPSYTVDTIEAVRNRWPEYTFQFLIGSDSLAQLPTWHEAHRLSQSVEFLVASRTGFPFEQTYTKTKRQLPELQAIQLTMPLLDVSSTWLRDRLEARLPTCGLCPVEVASMWRNSCTDS